MKNKIQFKETHKLTLFYEDKTVKTYNINEIIIGVYNQDIIFFDVNKQEYIEEIFGYMKYFIIQ